MNTTQSTIRVAAACPTVKVGNPKRNTDEIIKIIKEATNHTIALICFPELSLSGYTTADMLASSMILDESLAGIEQIANETSSTHTAVIVGLPLQVNNALYNCAAVIAGGKIVGVVPKTNLPTYREFYEKRWFSTPTNDIPKLIEINGEQIPFGADLLFVIDGTMFGIEICEDVWVANQPSINLAAGGALVICNLSTSPELVGKTPYRRELITQQSARLVAGYIYSSSDESESTTDVVMSGHCLITENGSLLAERAPLSNDNRLIVADLDLDHLRYDRRKDTNYQNKGGFRVLDCAISTKTPRDTKRYIAKHPFVPSGQKLTEHVETILSIQAAGLATRLINSKTEHITLGLSGGLDSTLALLVATRAFAKIGLPLNNIHTVTMPAHASSKRTQTNAVKLASALGVSSETIPIGQMVADELTALNHDTKTQDLTYENVQARLRTAILFNKANQIGRCLVLGTGDLSELALGWCTYNGDHMSSYNVNASIPKTLVRSLVSYIADTSDNKQAVAILKDILDTPISPELTSTSKGISQQTESLIGPYELHDFFMYYMVRWQDTPSKIYQLTSQAFSDEYSDDEIKKWLAVFLRRFYTQQFKRSALPDGPKVGSVSLSPRGDWRMPSDIATDLPQFLQADLK